MTPREKYIATLRSILGKPYIYGGNGPDVFDCSGAVLFCLRAAGFTLPDMTAAQIADTFHRCKVLPAVALPGDLFFYGTDESKPSHVMSVLERWGNGQLMLAGARNGGSHTVDIASATAARAYVGTAFHPYRTDFITALDPFRGVDG